MQNNQNKHEIVKQFIPKLLKVTDNYLTINENLTKLSNNITNISDKTDNQNLKSIIINLCKQILDKIDCLKYQIQLHKIVNDRQTIAFTFDKPISKEEVRRILDGNN